MKNRLLSPIYAIFCILALLTPLDFHAATNAPIPSVMAAQKLVNSGKTNQEKLQIYQALISPEGYNGQVILEKYRNIITAKLTLWAQKQDWFPNTSTTQQPVSSKENDEELAQAIALSLETPIPPTSHSASRTTSAAQCHDLKSITLAWEIIKNFVQDCVQDMPSFSPIQAHIAHSSTLMSLNLTDEQKTFFNILLQCIEKFTKTENKPEQISMLATMINTFCENNLYSLWRSYKLLPQQIVSIEALIETLEGWIIIAQQMIESEAHGLPVRSQESWEQEREEIERSPRKQRLREQKAREKAKSVRIHTKRS